MPKFVIERDIANVGKLAGNDLRQASAKSCAALRELGPSIQWVHSYLTDNKLYCIYIAENEAVIREHAQLSGFPANRISEVRKIIDPTTAE